MGQVRRPGWVGGRHGSVDLGEAGNTLLLLESMELLFAVVLEERRVGAGEGSVLHSGSELRVVEEGGVCSGRR